MKEQKERRKFDLVLPSDPEPYGDFYGYYYSESDQDPTHTRVIELHDGDCVLSREEIETIVNTLALDIERFEKLNQSAVKLRSLRALLDAKSSNEKEGKR